MGWKGGPRPTLRRPLSKYPGTIGTLAATAIRTEARSLLRMILNLLDLSRGDEGRLVPAPLSLQLSAVAGAVIEEFRIAAGSSNVTLVADVPPDQCVHADPGLLERILANLVENALRHSPDGGTVRIGGTHQADRIVICVADTGTGVPAELRARVFERFESTGGARNRGLGLAFCKLAVEAHGGTIWIDDAAPGAVFCMSFPT